MGDYQAMWAWAKEYRTWVRPAVGRALLAQRREAERIPDPGLRQQALSSITEKAFHCEGGGVYAAPSRDPDGRLLAFLIPYQTLCDYLDTVTDRGPSDDPADLRCLHQALADAVNPYAPLGDYYRCHPVGDDAGYLAGLVLSAQRALALFPGYAWVKPRIEALVRRYIHLQVAKHGPPASRVTALVDAHRAEGPAAADLFWWEHAAATGSTLGIFALLNRALSKDPPPDLDAVQRLYFPWLSALHILLDYFVDQEEDRRHGDLNFVAHYPSAGVAAGRLQAILSEVVTRSQPLGDGAFHRYVAHGLLGFYLSDRKLRHAFWGAPCRLLGSGGAVSVAVYLLALGGRSP